MNELEIILSSQIYLHTEEQATITVKVRGLDWKDNSVNMSTKVT